MKYFVIVNPLSKHAKQDSLEKIRGMLGNVETLFSNYAGESIELAYNVSKNFFNDEITIIAVGGDGTINEVCEGIVKAGRNDIAIGIIPAGTANVIAKELKIPKKLSKAIEIILKNKKRKIFLSEINKKYFLFTCGIGFDGMIVENVNLKLKKIAGKFAYILSAFRVLSNLEKLPYFKIIAENNQNLEAQTAIINRTEKYAGNFKIFNNANIFSQEFEVLIFRKLNLKILLNFLYNVFIKKDFSSKKNYQFIPSNQVKIESLNNLSVQVDGDFFKDKVETVKVSKDKYLQFIVAD